MKETQNLKKHKPLETKTPNLLQKKKKAKTLCTETQNHLHKSAKPIAPQKHKTHCQKKRQNPMPEKKRPNPLQKKKTLQTK